MIRPCVSNKIRLQDVVGATVGREMVAWTEQGVNTDTVAGGLNMPKGRGMGKIWVDVSLGPISSFKNQAVKVSGYWRSTYR